MSRVLRRVVDRRQDFRSSQDHPEGYIVEVLECGHERIEDIAAGSFSWADDGENGTIEHHIRALTVEEIENKSGHVHNAIKRRCTQCESREPQ